MKRLLLTLVLCLCLPLLCAAEPAISSDRQSFDPLTGTYDLQGHVRVDFGTYLICGDAAQVNIYQLQVRAQGGITFRNSDITFLCDQVRVEGRQSTAYVRGHLRFTQSGGPSISADDGSFNWQSKLAVFTGAVVVDGIAHSGTVTYNTELRTFVS
jgi:lipopolysaccharide export system protein LptA